MLRAYLVDMTVLRDYSRALLGLGFFVAVCVSLGMQTSVMAPGLLAMMYLLLGVSGTNSFDDLNGWERLRLTMPFSRRDVVLARYGAIATLGLGGLALGLAAALLLAAVAGVVPLPGELSSALALSEDALMGMVFSATVLFAVGRSARPWRSRSSSALATRGRRSTCRSCPSSCFSAPSTLRAGAA